MPSTELDRTQSRTIEDYAAMVASESPTPGGGSVAATVGALSCALAEMVCNVTVHGKSQPTEPELLRRGGTAGAVLRATLLGLAHADERAYGGYQAASALPRSTDEEKRVRREALDRALVESANVPLEIARACADVLDQFLIAARHGTKHALSDVSTGALLAEAAIRGALLTVRANAELMRDDDERNRYLETVESLQQRGATSTQRVLSAVQERVPALQPT
jgi:formiminotetrahydrofolate cyclodeaminase